MDISVVITTYNRGSLLLRSITSVLNQTYDSIEIIVVDDHSDIPAEDIIGRSTIDPSSLTIYRHSQNRDVAAARNTGIRLATGDWVAFLDDDDEWRPEKIERQVEGVHQSGAGAIYTGIEHRHNGRTTAIKSPEITGDITKQLLQRNFIGTPSTIMARADLITEVGGFDEQLPICQDWDFNIRLSTLTTFESIPEPLTIQHRHEESQLTDDYETRRRVTAPMLIKKHREIAERFDVVSEFEATVEAELGWVALNNWDFGRARSHFRRSLQYHGSVERFLLFLMAIGGPRTYSFFQRSKRAIPGGFKFKQETP